MLMINVVRQRAARRDGAVRWRADDRSRTARPVGGGRLSTGRTSSTVSISVDCRLRWPGDQAGRHGVADGNRDGTGDGGGSNGPDDDKPGDDAPGDDGPGDDGPGDNGIGVRV